MIYFRKSVTKFIKIKKKNQKQKQERNLFNYI